MTHDLEPQISGHWIADLPLMDACDPGKTTCWDRLCLQQQQQERKKEKENYYQDKIIINKSDVKPGTTRVTNEGSTNKTEIDQYRHRIAICQKLAHLTFFFFFFFFSGLNMLSIHQVLIRFIIDGNQNWISSPTTFCIVNCSLLINSWAVENSTFTWIHR